MAGIFPDSFGGSGGLFGNAFPQPQQPQNFGGMLGNNSNAILGYLAGALQGGNLGQSIGRGLQGWQQGQQQDQQRQIPGATWRALKAAGVPDATAQAAALNPDIMRAITPHYFQRLPSFGAASSRWKGKARNEGWHERRQCRHHRSDESQRSTVSATTNLHCAHL
jgi:hypothetical protein